ncbi:MAG: DAK2 domain-containing protein, partial [Ancrocorticia sp.]
DEAASDKAAFIAAAIGAAQSIQDMGGAEQGDKTMVDATIPFAEALNAASEQTLAQAWSTAADAAQAAADDTANFAAKKGRARTHGGKSVGTPDPGAISFAMLMRTIADNLG